MSDKIKPIIVILVISVFTAALVVLGLKFTGASSSPPSYVRKEAGAQPVVENQQENIAVTAANDQSIQSEAQQEGQTAKEADYQNAECFTEKEAAEAFEDRGFAETKIYTEYTSGGDYSGSEYVISESDNKHPVYRIYQPTEDGSIWSITIVGRHFQAVLIKNSNSNEDEQKILSESEVIYIYDSEKKAIYSTSFDIVQSKAACEKVSKIDLQTLKEHE